MLRMNEITLRRGKEFGPIVSGRWQVLPQHAVRKWQLKNIVDFQMNLRLEKNNNTF